MTLDLDGLDDIIHALKVDALLNALQGGRPDVISLDAEFLCGTWTVTYRVSPDEPAHTYKAQVPYPGVALQTGDVTRMTVSLPPGSI